MTRMTFGTLDDGTVIEEARIEGGGLALSLIGWGASIRDLTFDAGQGARPMVLGLETLEHYRAYASHMGAIAGRYANRIGQGRFTLDGIPRQVTRNQADTHHLHGGTRGFGKRGWRLEEAAADRAVFTLSAADGEEGYPGKLDVTATYAIVGDGRLTIDLEAVTDAPTIVNLATHSYFNLDGGADILDHLLEIPADAYTPVDAGLIPTGEIREVAGTPFDFRIPHAVRREENGERVAFDHNFVVARDRASEPRLLARLTGPRTAIRLDVFSTEPGVQFYDAAKMDVPVPGTHGRRFGANAGLCLEPQLFPDTPNNPTFGDAVLRPGEVYRQRTEYRFSRV